MTASPATSADHVFVNCPFDDDYAPTLQALLFSIRASGFLPRSARELDDGGQPRIEKLYGIRYGIHDLSQTALDAQNKLPRSDTPLELGIFMGAKRYGAPGTARKASADLRHGKVPLPEIHIGPPAWTFTLTVAVTKPH